MLTMVQHAEKLADERYRMCCDTMQEYGRFDTTSWEEYLGAVEMELDCEVMTMSAQDVVEHPPLMMHWLAFDARWCNIVDAGGWPPARAEGE